MHVLLKFTVHKSNAIIIITKVHQI